MQTSQLLRQQNIAEFLIYMWQIEDLLRALNLDIDQVKSQYLVRFSDLDAQQMRETEEWYANLIEMMRSEKITQSGHLQICHNVIINLTDLHRSLLNSQKFPYYKAAYHEALPLIVELRAKQGHSDDYNELESCFELLYGVMLLKMQQRPVSEETQQALGKISTFIAMLSDYYHKTLIEPLDL